VKLNNPVIALFLAFVTFFTSLFYVPTLNITPASRPNEHHLESKFDFGKTNVIKNNLAQFPAESNIYTLRSAVCSPGYLSGKLLSRIFKVRNLSSVDFFHIISFQNTSLRLKIFPHHSYW
jgi:hypothetical protein